MKFWPGIRHIRYLFSPRWKHFLLAMKNVRKSVDNAMKDIKNSDAHIAVAISWLEDAEYEWNHLQAIRNGEE